MMLFNSIEFFVFLPIAFFLYWIVFPEKKVQNFLLVVLSYVFYGTWDWRFLSLIILSTLVDFTVGILISKSENPTPRKLYLSLSLMINIGLLLYFKYCNFFINSFCDLLSSFGANCNLSTLSIVLPVGISFYTFQTLSYSIDVFKRKLEPETNIINFSAYVAFFPQLIAGPIERAVNLLPQFNVKRVFNYALAINGLRQILWGLFKKVVVADNCAPIVDLIFSSPDQCDSIILMIGSILFAFQIYCDFSGYSDIAIGIGKLLGIKLMVNFRYPYFSRDIAEFWRRWHISLSTWFRDYIYIPLGGSRVGKAKSIRNIFVIFLVSGFWHGANWTFVMWGLINAFYFLPQFLRNTNRKHISNAVERLSISSLGSILITFSLTCLAWIFFRADGINSAFSYIYRIGTFPLVIFEHEIYSSFETYASLFYITVMITIEWYSRNLDYPMFDFHNVISSKVIRYLVYIVLSVSIYYYIGNDSAFIYFQF